MPFAILAGHPSRDARVRVWSNSVADVIAKGDLMFDALLLDTNNGLIVLFMVQIKFYINLKG